MSATGTPARFALTGARIFDGESWHENHALLVAGDSVAGIFPRTQLPDGTETFDTGGGILAPGFVDLQVNGGGGIMLNDRQDVDAIRTICAAHARFGTTALLPTLITDRAEAVRAALAAGADAARQGVPGFLGLHLEGPHLALARKGAHDGALIRPMTDDDEALLLSARPHLPVLMVTLAPEVVGLDRIARLAATGILVSLGHSDASCATAAAAADAGATLVTHIFNAMSQMGSREPGLVGAALDTGSLQCGLIADGFHVDPVTIRNALRAKEGPGRLFLVTDAMAPFGTDETSFELNGRTILRREGRLTLEDGTLAGADLDLPSAIRFMTGTVGVELGEALRMAGRYPAAAAGLDDRYGRLGFGSRADIVLLSEALDVRSVWVGGAPVS